MAGSKAFWTTHFPFEVAFDSEWYVSLKADRQPPFELALLNPDHPTVPLAFRRRLNGGLTLDFEVDDIESEEQRLLALGATHRKSFTNEEGYGWRIYTDPVGHPFCLCRNKPVKWIEGEPVWPA